jgi:3-methyl-2-oxobutanoate hydroxymethyltransferase
MSTTVQDLQRFKDEHHRFVMLTAYECQLARIFDNARVPLILVGDTLGIFALGHGTTIPVTMDDMVHHCQAVTRSTSQALVVGDMPFGSYEESISQGVRNAIRLVKEGGVAMVKLEGPRPDLVRAIVSSGVPVMGHLGLTPQSFHVFGGNRVQARTEAAVDSLVDAAARLDEAGVSAVVLEAVPNAAAKRVTESLVRPTIGIGAGPDCDGQVLVGPEMLGLSTGPRPKYAKPYAELAQVAQVAAEQFMAEVASGDYPDRAHSYDWAIKAS